MLTLLTWNCCGGPLARKSEALQRYSPDLAVLQEAPMPGSPLPSGTYWNGTGPRKGVLVSARPPFSVSPIDTGVPESPRPSAYAYRVTGPFAFTLLAVWSQRDPYPYYKRGIHIALDALRHLPPPYVVAGDFNGSVIWDRPRARHTHGALVSRLATDFGLVSAYHHFHAEEQGFESRPTLYWTWAQDKPFHIDYCFVPREWAAGLTSVYVAPFAELNGFSDHRPLVVQLTPPAAIRVA